MILRNSQKGVSVYFVFFILTLLLSIGFGMSTLLIQQLQILRGLGHSVFAFYASETGLEAVLYADQVNCLNAEDRIQCINENIVPSFTLENDGQVNVLIEAPGASCSALSYCVKSTGKFKDTQRAIRIAR